MWLDSFLVKYFTEENEKNIIDSDESNRCEVAWSENTILYWLKVVGCSPNSHTMRMVWYACYI